MTRETKVGLVVACSFLCLVGIVVASKWRNGDTTTKEPEQQEIRITTGKEGQPGNPLVAPEKQDEGRPGARPVAEDVVPPPPNLAKPANDDAHFLRNRKETNDNTDHVYVGQMAPSPQSGAAVSGPFADVKPPVVGPDGPAAVAPPNLPAPGSGGTVTFEPPNPFAAPPGVVPAGQQAAPFPPVKPPEAAAAFPGTVEPKRVGAGPMPPPLLALPPQSRNPASVLDKQPPPAISPSQPTNPVSVLDKQPPPAIPPPQPTDPAPLLDKQPPPAIPPSQPTNPAPLLGKQPPPLIPPPLNEQAPILGDKAPVRVNPPPGPAPIDANFPLPVPPPQSKDPIPQIPRESAPDLPPIVVKGAKPSPVVKETTVDEYTCQQGDSVFENLSMRFYGTAKYADALKAYNRANSTLVSAGGSNLTIDPPVLTPGQKVLHPPKEILERDFGSSIRATAVAPPPANPGIAPTVKIAGPTPLQPAPNPTPIANAAAGGMYRVQNPNGESILDIAERLLGNRSRWTAIYDLNRANPAVQPQFRIPVGTELKMPAS